MTPGPGLPVTGARTKIGLEAVWLEPHSLLAVAETVQFPLAPCGVVQLVGFPLAGLKTPPQVLLQFHEVITPVADAEIVTTDPGQLSACACSPDSTGGYLALPWSELDGGLSAELENALTK